MEIDYVLKQKKLLANIISSEILIEKQNLRLKQSQTDNIFSITEYENKREQFNQNFKNFFALDLPEIGKFTLNKNSKAIWLKINSYFVVTKENYNDVINAFHNVASVTDQTGGWSTFNLEGKLSISMLEKLLTLDLDLFTKEKAVRASINKINCLILCNKQSEVYTIYCPSSFLKSMKIRLIDLVNLVT